MGGKSPSSGYGLLEMSHPENTMKQIIERQDRKIEGLEKLLVKVVNMYELRDSLNSQENRKFLQQELDKVMKL